MFIYNTQIRQGNPKYYGMPNGATLQDELGGRGNYGVDGSGNKSDTDTNNTKDAEDDNFFCMTKTQLITGVLLGIVGGVIIYQLFLKTKNPTTTPTQIQP